MEYTIREYAQSGPSLSTLAVDRQSGILPVGLYRSIDELGRPVKWTRCRELCVLTIRNCSTCGHAQAACSSSAQQCRMVCIRSVNKELHKLHGRRMACRIEPSVTATGAFRSYFRTDMHRLPIPRHSSSATVPSPPGHPASQALLGNRLAPQAPQSLGLRAALLLRVVLPRSHRSCVSNCAGKAWPGRQAARAALARDVHARARDTWPLVGRGEGE